MDDKMSSKKVIIIRGRAIDPAVHKIASTLSKHGYDVKLLLWDRTNIIQKNKFSEYAIHTFNLKAPYDKFLVVLFFPLWWAYQLFFIIKNDCDIVHACDLDTLIPAVLAKKIKRLKLVYIIYDSYSNFIQSTSILSNKIKNFVAETERSLINHVDALLLVDEARKDEIKGINTNNVSYIYNSPSDYLSGSKINRIKHDKFTLFYAGNIVKSRGIDDIITAIDGLNDVRLIFAGNGVDIEIVKYNEKINPNISYLGFISYDEVIRYTLDADALFRFSDPKLAETKYASPNKIFEAMMCGKPIIVSDNSSMADIVRDNNFGIIVPYGDIAAIRNAIVRLRDDCPYRSLLNANSRKAYDDKYNWGIMERRLISVYCGLSGDIDADP